jgi:hypothetical protein
MEVYTCSEARQNMAVLLEKADQGECVLIRHKDGHLFELRAYEKMRLYVKGAGYLLVGFGASILCPFGFLILPVFAVIMRWRSSREAEELPVLFEKPEDIFGRKRKEPKVLALTDKRLDEILQFHMAGKLSLLRCFVPPIELHFKGFFQTLEKALQRQRVLCYNLEP